MAICDLVTYRRLTADRDSYDGDILNSLIDAQRFVEDYCGRWFESDERTEKVYLHCDKVYPRALPVTVVPSGYDIDGYAVTRLTDPGYYTVTRPVTINLVYTGGFEPEDMPVEVQMAVARLAHRLLTPSEFPAGATSVAVGDVSYSGAGLSASEMDSTTTALLRPWRMQVTP